MRLGLFFAVALPLAVADLAHKASAHTELWAYHERSLGWLGLCLVLFVVTVWLVRVPAAGVAFAAGLLGAGVLGNGMSAAWNDLRVPNPIVVRGDHVILAFNLADICALVGILALVITLSTWLVRNRELLPTANQIWSAGRRPRDG